MSMIPKYSCPSSSQSTTPTTPKYPCPSSSQSTTPTTPKYSCPSSSQSTTPTTPKYPCPSSSNFTTTTRPKYPCPSSGYSSTPYSSPSSSQSTTPTTPKYPCPSSPQSTTPTTPKYPCPSSSNFTTPTSKYPCPSSSSYSSTPYPCLSNMIKHSYSMKCGKVPDRPFEKIYSSVEDQDNMAVNVVGSSWNKKEQEDDIVSKLNKVHLPKESEEKNTKNEKENSTTTPEDDSLSQAEVSLLAKISRTKLVTTKADIEVQRKDPFSPLHSVKTFEALHLKPNLLKGVYEMGFNAPSKIQETALPILLANPPQNMIAQSQSGTGKTAAFVLAMLTRVNTQLDHPQVLCLSPTYELAIQTGEVAAKMGQFCEDIKIKYAVRGEDLPRGSKLTEHIVIGTPGKVLDWSIKYKFFDLSKITVFVLDEADVMIATQGHQDQSFRIRRMLKENACQIMLFSATYDDEVMDFAQAIVPNPIIIRLKREEESLDNIKQHYVICESQEEKYNAIANIYGGITVGQAMIFCQTRRTASWLSEKMTRDGHAVALLSGELTVDQRISVLDRFREGKEKVLITTNVLARGIDVEQVTIVVNFDLPLNDKGRGDCETYLHRIGRTGRFGKRGLAINLVSMKEVNTTLREIQEHFGKKIALLNTDDYDEVERLNS